MAYAAAGIHMFMEKLNQLIHCNDNNIPFINHHHHHPVEIITSQRPQFQLLYDDLASIIQALSSIDQHQDLEKVNDLNQIFRDAAQEAEYTVDLFLSRVHISNLLGDDYKRSLNLWEPLQFPSPQKKLKLSDENIVVGLERDVELVRDRLVADRPTKLDVVSIVGMDGIGKTTLATKVFNDPFVVYHFHVRVWATVSQTYDKRYLMVIDDVWDIDAWDNLRLFLPHDNTGSRVMLTSRLTEVAKHAKSGGFVHHLGSLNQERSWELLCQKVFRGIDCKGLPLAVVAIAGVLAKKAWNEKFWAEIAYKTGSYIAGEGNGCLEMLGLSYRHLPLYLRECFLYLGGFPEDYEFEVKWLMWLWAAEGFIKEDGNRSLEDIAEGYLMDLIDRNLVIVHSRKSNGGVKACKMHDLIRELCLKKVREERFVIQIDGLILPSNVITPPYKPIRKFINTDDPGSSHPSTQNLRSLLFVRHSRYLSDGIEKYFGSFVLLRVLDLQRVEITFPDNMELLVHLRYLAMSICLEDFPSSICKLWNLQTLIYKSAHTLFCESRDTSVVLPSNISDLVNLRHLKSLKCHFDMGSIEKPMNLQTISRVRLTDEAFSFQKYFPCIRKLSCITESYKQNDFISSTHLERLSLRSFPVHGKNQIALPATLKALTLRSCCLPWSDMSIIQSLPNLQVLKLHSDAFVGSCWNTDGQEFPQLKFLRLDELNIKQWEVYSPSFPCLKQLEINRCLQLEEIPLEIVDIPTLELVKIRKCAYSIDESVRRIRQEQQDMGNYGLKIVVVWYWL
ncbi:putative late blight resistance protein homolog R1B-14 [Bidens hawaiensis]|uniref:putative late blight resistance protein homolog R1B-14 n=1 Tax=Bidens hawaiensis TaxID=980011 RepID=UPI00404B2C7B